MQDTNPLGRVTLQLTCRVVSIFAGRMCFHILLIYMPFVMYCSLKSICCCSCRELKVPSRNNQNNKSHVQSTISKVIMKVHLLDKRNSVLLLPGFCLNLGVFKRFFSKGSHTSKPVKSFNQFSMAMTVSPIMENVLSPDNSSQSNSFMTFL